MQKSYYCYTYMHAYIFMWVANNYGRRAFNIVLLQKIYVIVHLSDSIIYFSNLLLYMLIRSVLLCSVEFLEYYPRFC
jgi:hypothetical protein